MWYYRIYLMYYKDVFLGFVGNFSWGFGDEGKSV